MAYEFTEQQNKTVTELSKYMKLVAIITIIVGIVDMIYSIMDAGAVDVVFSAFIIIIGLAFYFPTDNLDHIVETEGSDIQELMQAFSELDKGWTFVLALLVIVAIYPVIGWLT